MNRELIAGAIRDDTTLAVLVQMGTLDADDNVAVKVDAFGNMQPTQDAVKELLDMAVGMVSEGPGNTGAGQEEQQA